MTAKTETPMKLTPVQRKRADLLLEAIENGDIDLEDAVYEVIGLQDENAALRSQLERAEKDAERYRYCVAAGFLDSVVVSYCMDKELDEPACECHTEDYKALADKAIDTARKEVSDGC